MKCSQKAELVVLKGSFGLYGNDHNTKEFKEQSRHVKLHCKNEDFFQESNSIIKKIFFLNYFKA